MAAVTIRFHGLQEKILEAITHSGLAESKTEAIRLALFKLAVDYGLVSEGTLLKALQEEAARKPIAVEELLREIEHAKTTSVH